MNGIPAIQWLKSLPPKAEMQMVGQKMMLVHTPVVYVAPVQKGAFGRRVRPKSHLGYFCSVSTLTESLRQKASGYTASTHLPSIPATFGTN